MCTGCIINFGPERTGMTVETIKNIFQAGQWFGQDSSCEAPP